MKKIYFLIVLLISAVSFGQTTVLQESFETDGNGTRYTTSVPEFTDVTGGDFFTRTDGTATTVPSYYQVSGQDGSYYFAAMDTDGDGNPTTLTLDFNDIDISSFTDLTFIMGIAEDDDGTNEDWDDVTSFIVEVDIDNSGTFTKILQFEAIELRPDGSPSTSNKEPAQDTDFDGVGDGTTLSPTFQDFTAAIGSGSVIDIKLTFTNLKNGDEDIAIDNIRIIDGYVATPTISVTSPTDATVFAPGTSSVNVEWTTANLSGSETFDITVNGNTTNGVTSPFAVATADGQTYNVTVDLVDGGVLDSDMTSFSVGTLTTVADIAALRADVVANGLGKFYEITGGSLVTHTDGFNNRKWVEDTNISGILIFDSADVITTTYSVGDMVTGLRGYTAEDSGVLRFIPTSDSGVVASSGNTVTPQIVTIAALNAAPEDYQSELVQLNNVTFTDGDGVATFSTGQNYDVTDGVETIVKRTDYFSADYIGELIPTGSLSSIVAIAGQFNTTAQIYVRNLSDLTLSIGQYEASTFSVYPNPSTTGFVNIITANADDLNVTVYDVLGKQVLNQTVNNNRLNVSTLNTGVYIMKISQNGTSATKKLVIK